MPEFRPTTSVKHITGHVGTNTPTQYAGKSDTNKAIMEPSSHA